MMNGRELKLCCCRCKTRMRGEKSREGLCGSEVSHEEGYKYRSAQGCMCLGHDAREADR